MDTVEVLILVQNLIWESRYDEAARALSTLKSEDLSDKVVFPSVCSRDLGWAYLSFSDNKTTRKVYESSVHLLRSTISSKETGPFTTVEMARLVEMGTEEREQAEKVYDFYDAMKSVNVNSSGFCS